MYDIKEETSYGQVQIAGDVVAVIAGIAASEVDGVYKLAGNLSNEIASRLGRKNPAKGVKVDLIPGEVRVDLGIIVYYEYKIKKVSEQVQEKVKQAIETMTGLTVTSVNVHVQGVNIPEENYRSTKTILEAANQVIKNNKSKIDKKLWTENKQGDKIVYNTLSNEYEEVEYIVDKIDEICKKEKNYFFLFNTSFKK